MDLGYRVRGLVLCRVGSADYTCRTTAFGITTFLTLPIVCQFVLRGKTCSSIHSVDWHSWYYQVKRIADKAPPSTDAITS